MACEFFEPNPVILAHRGDSAYHPENTLPAFLSARELGVDVIETDVHLTRDGEVVIWHDERLDRMTDGSGTVESYSLKQLLEFDAGYSFTRDGGKSYPYRGKGITLLPLKEALEKLPDMRFNVDLKTPDTRLADAFAELVRTIGAQRRVLCASFHAEMLSYVRRWYPELCTSFAEEEVKRLLIRQKLHLPVPGKLIPGAALQVPVAQGRVRIVTPGFIRRFHRLGLRIHVWTINDSDEMIRLLRMGVDGLFTDDPRLLRQVVTELARNGKSHPADNS